MQLVYADALTWFLPLIVWYISKTDCTPADSDMKYSFTNLLPWPNEEEAQ